MDLVALGKRYFKFIVKELLVLQEIVLMYESEKESKPCRRFDSHHD
jgi:hypothetical protein